MSLSAEVGRRGCTASSNSAEPDSPMNIYAVPRQTLHWDDDLHDRFTAACDSLGGAWEATPKLILEAMERSGGPTLTNLQIKSHLQRYRNKLIADGVQPPPKPNPQAAKAAKPKIKRPPGRPSKKAKTQSAGSCDATTAALDAATATAIADAAAQQQDTPGSEGDVHAAAGHVLPLVQSPGLLLALPTMPSLPPMPSPKQPQQPQQSLQQPQHLPESVPPSANQAIRMQAQPSSSMSPFGLSEGIVPQRVPSTPGPVAPAAAAVPMVPASRLAEALTRVTGLERALISKVMQTEQLQEELRARQAEVAELRAATGRGAVVGAPLPSPQLSQQYHLQHVMAAPVPVPGGLRTPPRTHAALPSQPPFGPDHQHNPYGGAFDLMPWGDELGGWNEMQDLPAVPGDGSSLTSSA